MMPATHPLPEFRPHPLLPGGQLQTLAAALLPGPLPSESADRFTVALDDGDGLMLHDIRPLGWRTGDRAAVLIHGLGGSAASPYMRRIAGKLAACGVRAFRMEMRGCGAGAGLARLPYHSGRSGDAAAALHAVAHRCPGSPITLIGFSLGGNVALKLAGECGGSPPAGLDSAVAVSPPIDLAACSRAIARSVNRLYDLNFARWLRRQVRDQAKLVGPTPADTFVRRHRPATLFEFDSHVIAPICGFADADDYYARSSAARVLASARVEVRMLADRRDPMVPSRIFGGVERPGVSLTLTRGGGHLGWITTAARVPDRRWMDAWVVRQVTSLPART
ncbi:MAG: hypothetical protein BIFFINMI_03617 [Phycisphaerae bacterium]|nr:hypothetical protein [Phycisphaerae bacterium]